ncbi:sclerostin domain-containing protein 1-like [Morone saxatilis]|uniref:sclerostin domain-containing protein 1-like n=1 Tax=Morone saxatilis TaxID=34816 RepID=UPI0015E228B0|nr:sclerostin domain-containing protein 1-like [Morone saxatilis]XP_035537736.1 sclerostin domain-containing protein 1-like [Morone saxatilis]
MLRPASGLQLLALLLLLSTSRSAVHNDATESVHPQEADDTQHEPAAEDTNQARNGGRRPADSVRNGPDQSQVGCRELRSTKYISDGQCTSVNPIKELVCAGECLPAHLLPNWIGGGGYTGRYWSRRDAQEWRCVIDRTRTQRIRLQCQDGSSRTYKITVVTSCKCKRYSRQQNDSGHKDTPVHSGKPRKNQRKAELPEERAGRQSDN